MKAAVLHEFGGVPKYEEFSDPVQGDGEVEVSMRAVALENVDRMVAAGTHFAATQFLPQLPAIVGFDGIGALPDGTFVGFGGIRPPYGAMAERVVVQHTVPVPKDVDAITAAALPGPALTSYFPLKYAVALQEGQTVLVNGATGVAGSLAVRIAKHLGAGRVVATGRHGPTLMALEDLGADTVIDLTAPDDRLLEAFKAELAKGIDIVLDFLWGRPTSMLVQAIVPQRLSFPERTTSLVQIGEAAGPTIPLPAEALRTSGLRILGGGAGITPEAIAESMEAIWRLVREGVLTMDIEMVSLKHVEAAWSRRDLHGTRLVIVP